MEWMEKQWGGGEKHQGGRTGAANEVCFGLSRGWLQADICIPVTHEAVHFDVCFSVGTLYFNKKDGQWKSADHKRALM